MEPFSNAVRMEVLRYAQLAAEMGLVPNTQGNVSVRDRETNLVLITPHDLPYTVMTPDDLAVVDLAAHQVGGPHSPSFETAVHCAIYRERPDVQAIVHTEPIYTNTLGVLHMPIEPVVVALLTNLGGPVPVMPYMASGSDAFGRELRKGMGKGVGWVCAHHGRVTVGGTLSEAFRRTVIVEHAAQIQHLALLHGRPVVLTESHIEGALA